jgi:hypothetical protein
MPGLGDAAAALDCDVLGPAYAEPVAGYAGAGKHRAESGHAAVALTDGVGIWAPV